MPIINNKVSVAVHPGYDLCPYSSSNTPSKEQVNAVKKRSLQSPAKVIEDAVYDAFKSGVLSRYPLKRENLEKRITDELDLYQKHTRGIIFASDSLLFVLRHPDGLESDGIISELLYNFAEETVNPDNLVFVPERGRGERVQQSETVVRHLSEILGRERLGDIELWGFGVYSDSCLPQNLCSIQKWTSRNPAIVLGSACDADSLEDACRKIGSYKNKYTRHDPAKQLRAVWNPSDEPQEIKPIT